MRSTRSIYRFGFAVLLSLAGFASQAFAQAQELPVDEKAQSNRAVALQCLRGPGVFAANEDKFNDYFKNYYFPAMTRTDPDKLGELGKTRDALFKTLIGKAGDPDAQRALIDIAFSEMGRIVQANPPCHPAARYNAILIIGQLDQKPSPDGRQLPEPYAKATKALTAVVNSATTGGQFPPAVILGAIVGLERHVQYRQSLSPESIAAISDALLKLVKHDEPIQEMDRDAYAWLRLRAATVLAKIGSVGDKNAVHDAIIKLAASGKSLDDRCAAAGLLEKLEYKDVKLDDAGTAEPLFALAREVSAAEDKRAQDFQDLHSTGFSAPGGGGRGGPRAPSSVRGGERGGIGEPTVETFPRRQTLARLTDLANGLKKVTPALPEVTQKKAAAVSAALNQAITVASNKDTVELTLAEELHKMANAINKAVPGPENAAADKAKENAAFN